CAPRAQRRCRMVEGRRVGVFGARTRVNRRRPMPDSGINGSASSGLFIRQLNDSTRLRLAAGLPNSLLAFFGDPARIHHPLDHRLERIDNRWASLLAPWHTLFCVDECLPQDEIRILSSKISSNRLHTFDIALSRTMVDRDILPFDEAILDQAVL